MARRCASKELWQKLQPLIPSFFHPARKPTYPCSQRRGCLPRHHLCSGNRYSLGGSSFSAHGFGSGMTCERRLCKWQAAGVWQQLHLAMLQHLREYDQIDWGGANADGSSAPSPPAARTAPNRFERNWPRTKRACLWPPQSFAMVGGAVV